MYRLHITNKNYSSWSLRPWLLMKALNIPFVEEIHPFPTDSVWEKFRKFSPNGKVPCLMDGDISVWDSMAITEYVAETYARVWPADRVARAWARCAVAEMHSGFGALRSQCSMSCGVRVRMPPLGLALQHELRRIDELWCDGLKKFGGPFLAGEHITAADAFYAPVVFRVQTYDLPLSRTATAYADYLLKLPAMQDWYEAALQERWREPAHEQEVAAAGTITADLRVPGAG